MVITKEEQLAKEIVNDYLQNCKDSGHNTWSLGILFDTIVKALKDKLS